MKAILNQKDAERLGLPYNVKNEFSTPKSMGLYVKDQGQLKISKMNSAPSN